MSVTYHRNKNTGRIVSLMNFKFLSLNIASESYSTQRSDSSAVNGHWDSGEAR